MVFKRLLGRGGIPLEVDTVVESGPVRPGSVLRGEVVVRAPERSVEVESISLDLVVGLTSGNTEYDDRPNFGHPSVSGWFTLEKGEEKRVPFRHRLRWESPVSEVNGQALGVFLGLSTEVETKNGAKGQTDHDLVHVAALPLHEAVIDAFAVEGYLCDTARIDDASIPRTESHLYLRQSFLLVDRLGRDGRPRELELTFFTNSVGCEIYLRKAALKTEDWRDKPPALRYVAAHHDVGRVDFAGEARQWISDVSLLRGHHAGEADEDDDY